VSRGAEGGGAHLTQHALVAQRLVWTHRRPHGHQPVDIVVVARHLRELLQQLRCLLERVEHRAACIALSRHQSFSLQEVNREGRTQSRREDGRVAAAYCSAARTTGIIPHRFGRATALVVRQRGTRWVQTVHHQRLFPAVELGLGVEGNEAVRLRPFASEGWVWSDTASSYRQSGYSYTHAGQDTCGGGSVVPPRPVDPTHWEAADDVVVGGKDGRGRTYERRRRSWPPAPYPTCTNGWAHVAHWATQPLIHATLPCGACAAATASHTSLLTQPLTPATQVEGGSIHESILEPPAALGIGRQWVRRRCVLTSI
jgi:hypothetical protein